MQLISKQQLTSALRVEHKLSLFVGLWFVTFAVTPSLINLPIFFFSWVLNFCIELQAKTDQKVEKRRFSELVKTEPNMMNEMKC